MTADVVLARGKKSCGIALGFDPLLAARSLGQAIRLTWDNPSAWDLHGHNVYLATTPGGPYTKANPTLVELPSRSFTASGLQGGTVYYAVIRAVDRGTNESADSTEVSAVPGP